MGTCFVIQPFDRGEYDKRYEDIFAPAIEAAGLEPYRVDRDPSVSIPIDDIQRGIEASEACLADITTDNPNVWFELGYALARGREVVLVCSAQRGTKFPFDVQHRTIILYQTESRRDFDDLATQIEERLKAILRRRDKVGQVARLQSVAKVEGLEQYEVATLVAVAEELDNPSDGITAYMVRQAMVRAGFTKVATTLGLAGLLSKQMLEEFEDEDYNGQLFTAYRVTGQGMAWLFENKEKLALTRESPTKAEDDDTVPF